MERSKSLDLPRKVVAFEHEPARKSMHLTRVQDSRKSLHLHDSRKSIQLHRVQPTREESVDFTKKAIKFADAQCLPLGLVFAVLAGAAFPWIGYRVGQEGHVAVFCVVALFFIAGLKLKTEEAKAALTAPFSLVIGLVSILGFTCIVGSGMTEYLPMNRDFKLGMIIFFCMPCTVNSGAVLAKQAGGNLAMALFLTVAGNLLGIFSCPVMLHYFADVGDVVFPVVDLMWSLTGTIFVPMIAGKFAQRLSFGGTQVSSVVTKYNKQITMLSNGLLITIPWMKISKSVMNGDLKDVTVGDAVMVLIFTSFVHIVFLFINYGLGMALQLELELHKSLVLVGSSKTLPMALSVLTFLPPQVSENGLLAVPMMIAHIGQIVMDGFLAANWAERTERERAELEMKSPQRKTPQVEEKKEKEAPRFLEEEKPEEDNDDGSGISIESSVEGTDRDDLSSEGGRESRTQSTESAGREDKSSMTKEDARDDVRLDVRQDQMTERLLDTPARSTA